MDEQAMMDERSRRLVHLIGIKDVVKKFGEENNVMAQDSEALDAWRRFGGTDETFAKINSRHFASMTKEQQAAFVRGSEVLGGK